MSDLNENGFEKIDKGNGLANNLTATTNDRLEKNILAIRDLRSSLDKFSKSSDKCSRKLIYLTWGLLVLTLVLVFLTIGLMYDAKEQTSSQNNIALNSQFYISENTKIINAIENKKPILVSNKGSFTNSELDNYLNFFETINSAYSERLLSESDLCISFSYPIEITSKNQEIKKYISEQQAIDKGFFGGFVELTDIVSKSKDKNCHAQ